MSRNLGSHTFTNSVNGSLIHVDVGLHEDIDYDFFDNDDNQNSKCQTGEEYIVIENSRKGEQSSSPGLQNESCHFEHPGKVVDNNFTPVKNNTDSVVRFSTEENTDSVSKKCSEKQIVSPRSESQTKLKDLMNCIAYDEDEKNDDVDDDDDDDVVSRKLKPVSPDILSLSTDTTSEITDVTTRPSSSGCSSMSKHESDEHVSDEKESESLNDSEIKQQKKGDNNSLSSMKLLLDALETFEKQERKSLSSSTMSSERRGRLGRINMSFTNDQCKKIQRENDILLKKLQNLRKPRPKPTPVLVAQPRLSSSAINRKKMQAKIDHENQILLKKIQQAKPSSRIATSSLRR